MRSVTVASAALVTAGLVAVVFAAAPEMSMVLVPLAVATLVVLFRIAPTVEHVALQRHSRLLARLGSR